jgi:hypothetical protein
MFTGNNVIMAVPPRDDTFNSIDADIGFKEEK